MTESKQEPGKWVKGKGSANPRGRPKGTGRPISRLRSTLNKLKELEPDAIDIISKGLVPDTDEEGEEISVNKNKLDTAKWLVSMIGTLTRSALAEESYRADQRKDSETEAQANGTTGQPPRRFSLPSDFEE